jgi:Competence protein CoiA-like family
MYVALDLDTGKQVRADAAQRRRYYRCPVCHSPVHLRKGVYRDAHFAHDPGQGKPECENFHPSDDWRGPVPDLPVFVPPAQIIPRQRLSLLLIVHALVGRAPVSWALEVLVPRAPTRSGSLKFDGGGDGFRVDVSCAKLSGGAQSYRVNPDAESYRVSWVSSDADRAFAQSVQQRIPGPNPNLTTVFAASRGNRKELAIGLDWGGTYYLLRRSDSIESIPPDIAVARLADSGGWSCSLITLPPMADLTIATWLRQATGLEVHPVRRRWGVPLPAMHALDPSARLVLDSGKDLLLAIYPGDADLAPVALRATAGGDEASGSLWPGVWNFVRLHGFSPTLPPMIEIGGHALPELLVRSFVRVAPQVVLQIGTEAVQGSSQLAGALLEQVRAGKVALNGMVFPSALEPKLRYRATGDLDWTKHSMDMVEDPDRHSVALTEATLEQTTAIIRDHGLDVVLDLGPFGYWWSDARSCVRMAAASVSPATRTHAAWVLSAAGRPSGAAGGSDQTLAAEIMALHPPRWLAAHHRLAKFRIQRERHVE